MYYNIFYDCHCRYNIYINWLCLTDSNWFCTNKFICNDCIARMQQRLKIIEFNKKTQKKRKKERTFAFSLKSFQFSSSLNICMKIEKVRSEVNSINFQNLLWSRMDPYQQYPCSLDRDHPVYHQHWGIKKPEIFRKTTFILKTLEGI